MNNILKNKDEITATIAAAAGYDAAEIKGGLLFAARKSRRTDPPGSFDNAGRFIAAERTDSVKKCRAPSRRWPFSEMHAARTAAHCAELASATPLNVKRVARLREEIELMERTCGQSAHSQIALLTDIQGKVKIAKPGSRHQP